jgi:hypothetical protein
MSSWVECEMEFSIFCSGVTQLKWEFSLYLKYGPPVADLVLERTQ